LITSRRRAQNAPLRRLLLATCLAALLTIGATTGTAAARPRTDPTATEARLVPRLLAVAASRSTAADRVLVLRARALKRCLRANRGHLARCKLKRHAVQQAGSRLARARRNLASLVRRTAIPDVHHYAGGAPKLRAPTLAVSGQKLTWTPIAHVRTYILASKAKSQADQYSLVSGTSTTPPAIPSATVGYSIRSDVDGSAWSAEQTIVYPTSAATSDSQAAPTIAVSGETLTWNAVAGVSTYVLVSSAPGQADQYSVVSGTSTTPPAIPGVTVRYSVRTAIDGSAWSPEVEISYPAVAAVPTPPPSVPVSVPAHKIIGTNDAAGWGIAAAKAILAGHITWNRVEIGSEDNTFATSTSDGFHALAIVGNVSDNTPLSEIDPSSWAATVVSQIQANPGIAIAEAGNEMFYKGNAANPVQYGRMYLAAIDAMQAAGIHTPLLFNMFGDYPVGSLSSSTWSRDSAGGGWLHDAVAGVPGLGSAILANGLSTHPYGALGENSTDSWGVGAVAAQEAVAQKVLGATPPFYITEFGYDLGKCGETDGACSQQEQASKMRSAYAAFLGDPHVAGIWCYQSHDDPTGQWGYMNNDNTVRPAFEVISSVAIEQGQ
jgi:hypothetical protein